LIYVNAAQRACRVPLPSFWLCSVPGLQSNTCNYNAVGMTLELSCLLSGSSLEYRYMTMYPTASLPNNHSCCSLL